MVFQNAELEDLVLLKSDGLPTYHLANVVDDHHMEISHIMRADEWIASAPLHARLYASFGWEMPAIAHLPVILSPSGKGKLSKRDQAFQDGGVRVLVQVREFKEAGYLPEAVVNFLLNTGWAFGDDREKFTVEEAMDRFCPEDIVPSAGRLPYEKLEWLNGVYIRELSAEELARQIKPFLEREGLMVDDTRLIRIAPLIQERIKTLADAPAWLGFIFRDGIGLDDPQQLIQKNMDAAGTAAALRASYDTLAALDDFSHSAQEAALRDLAERLGLKAGQLFGSVRVAISAQAVSPPLFESMEILGKETSLARIQAALELLNGR
jgi:glutamyl-tRNA synthetase